MLHKSAARVLPDPVGANMSVRWCQYERVISRCDGWPAAFLGRTGGCKTVFEPVFDDRVKSETVKLGIGHMGN